MSEVDEDNHAKIGVLEMDITSVDLFARSVFQTTN